MSSPILKRSTLFLAGVGLVLVGLLAGILAMLFVEQGALERPARVVERVEIGRRPAPPSEADSSLPALPAETVRLESRFKEVAQRVTPSVVYIEVRVPASSEEGGRFRDFDPDAPERFFREPRQSVGSGVVIGEDGYIVTNNHVVEDAEAIRVTLSDKRQYEAEVVGTDASTDLAVIQAEDASGLPVMTFGNSDGVEVGEWVIAIGNPFRLTSTVTAGIIGALGRQVNIIEDTFGIEDFIQTDAAISPGNSGGALVNLRGELVGINTAIASRSGSYEGYGFAVPVNLMKRVAADLIEYGEVRRGYLGVTIGEVNAQAARQMGLSRIGGVYVSETQPDGAAYRAGIRAGDVVLTVGEQPVDAPNELQSAIAQRRPGDRVPMTVWRDGARRRYVVELTQRDESWASALEPQPPQPVLPEEPPEMRLFELEAWGIGLRAAGAPERRAFGRAEGVYLAYVGQGSPAAEAGLPRGVLLTHVEGEAVTTVEEALSALAAAEDGTRVLLRVLRRDGVSAFYEVEAP